MSACRCSSVVVSASKIRPTRQPPSLIWPGVSPTRASVAPETSTPSTSPEPSRKAMRKLQRSLVAGITRLLAPQGHATSQLQFSKYVPSMR
jgi:hypothetical protein